MSFCQSLAQQLKTNAHEAHSLCHTWLSLDLCQEAVDQLVKIVLEQLYLMCPPSTAMNYHVLRSTGNALSM
jgi:hypothetical protein